MSEGVLSQLAPAALDTRVFALSVMSCCMLADSCAFAASHFMCSVPTDCSWSNDCRIRAYSSDLTLEGRHWVIALQYALQAAYRLKTSLAISGSSFGKEDCPLAAQALIKHKRAAKMYRFDPFMVAYRGNLHCRME